MSKRKKYTPSNRFPIIPNRTGHSTWTDWMNTAKNSSLRKKENEEVAKRATNKR
jgi:hypothetical protein